MSAGRACDVSAACHWAVNGAAAAGAGKMWGGAYTVTPSAIFAAPDSGYQVPEDLADVPVAVGYHSGSHYATVQALEPFLEKSRINLKFVGLPNDRIRLLRRGEVQVANLFGAQYYIAEQLGYRKITDATFMVGFLISADADPEQTRKYFAALLDRDLDIAYVIRWNLPDEARFEPLRTAEPAFLAAPDHPLAAESTVSVDDVMEAGLIAASLTAPESHFYRELLYQRGIDRENVRLEVDGQQTRLWAAAAGLGVVATFVPRYARDAVSETLTWLPVEGRPVTVDLGLVRQHDDDAVNSTSKLASWLRELAH